MNNHSVKKQPKDDLIKRVWETARDVQYKIQSEDDEEKQWLIQNSPNSIISTLIKEMTVLMMHVLEAIGQLEPVNGIGISKQFGISRGSISKITKKLVDKELIIMETLPENKKEILFRTTALGKEICRLHQDLHKQIDSGINYFLQQYTEDELGTTLKVLNDALHTSWINAATSEEPIEHNPEETQTNEKAKLNSIKVSLSSSTAEEMNEVIEMLNKLDSRNLKKAKVILNEIFF
ncbi:MarR family transcriptional regulator [Peribacillus butanolivorans]|uniref:MarR family transcriptional regulator n=1 Tax=Peribacillus butanolivorans TaxID=421767 RepID=UPI0037C9609F